MVDVVEEVRKFVEEECEKHKLGEEILENHFKPVVDYCVLISEGLVKEGNEIDLEVLEIAAWLHDIGSIIFGRENHHRTGAEVAEKELQKLNYPQEKIKKIKECILNHRGSKEDENKRDFIEARILVDADAITAFDNIEGHFLWVIEADGIKKQKEVKEKVKNKLKNKWNQLVLEKSKELVRKKYEAAMLLLGEEDGN